MDSEALGGLKRSFGRWIYKSYVLKKRPGISLPDINDFNEVHAVLEERVEQWNRELIEKGRLLGRQEGRLEGESRALARLLTRRFGPLPGSVAERLAGAAEAELEAWTDAVLEADSLEAVFSAPPASH